MIVNVVRKTHNNEKAILTLAVDFDMPTLHGTQLLGLCAVLTT